MKLNVDVEIAEHLFTKDRLEAKALLARELETTCNHITEVFVAEHDKRSQYLPNMVADIYLVTEEDAEPVVDNAAQG